jgi:hypothetical protein
MLWPEDRSAFTGFATMNSTKKRRRNENMEILSLNRIFIIINIHINNIKYASGPGMSQPSYDIFSGRA